MKKENWITVNGNHILIKDGQTVEEAVAERFDSLDRDDGVNEPKKCGRKIYFIYESEEIGKSVDKNEYDAFNGKKEEAFEDYQWDVVR